MEKRENGPGYPGSQTQKARLKERKLFVYDTVGHLASALLILFGAACILWTRQVYQLLPFLLGGAMAAIGLNNTIFGIWTREFAHADTRITANGIVYFVLGLVILCHHQNADAIIGSIWGMLGLIKGAEALNISIYQLTQKKPFLLSGLRAVVELLLGIMLLLVPDTAVLRHVFLLGLELLLAGWKLFREASQKKTALKELIR